MKNAIALRPEMPLEENSQTNVTSPELIQIFLQELDVSKDTKREYTTILNCFCRFLEEKEIQEPKRKDVVAYKEELLENGRSPRTVRLYLCVLKSYFSWLSHSRLYPDITDNLKSPRITKEMKRQALTSDQVAGILESIDRTSLSGKQTYALILLASSTGLRSGELSSLRISDWINFQNKTFLKVRRKGYQEKQMVAIGPKADSAIRDCLKDREIYKPEEPLFISTSNRNHGQAITPKSIGRIFKNELRVNGFDSSLFTGHSFRHTAAAIGMSICDNDIFTVKKFMGHSNIETTVLYADHNALLGQDLAAQIEGKLISKENSKKEV